MQAYFKEDLENNLLTEQADVLFNSKFIEKSHELNIEKNIQKLNTSPNLFARLGFALLGIFLLSSIFGALALLTLSGLDSNFKACAIFYFIVALVATEVVAKQKMYTHGIDDVFVIGTQIAFAVAVGVCTEMEQGVLPVLFAIFIISTFCTVRYVNTLAVLGICGSVLGIFFYLIVEKHLLSSALLPFVGLLLAFGIYYASQKLSENPKLLIYHNGFSFAKVLSYLLGYFSVNYLVVRQLSEELLHLELQEGENIPFAFIFYALTFLVPLAYFYFALKNHNRSLLYIAVFCLGFSVFTIRYYHSVLPIEFALTLGGIVLFAIAFFAIKYLKNKQTGITFVQDRYNNKSIILNAQALVINSQMNTAVPEQNMEFGGGEFSGGGAGENF